MTSEELESIIAGGETLNLECKLAKSAIPVNFWETFSAFANTDGGIILLGVREENHQFSIEGVDDARKIVADFWNMVHSLGKISADIVFDHHVQVVNADGRNVVVIEVPRADRQDRPVYIGEDVFKGTFRRNGDGDYRCSKEAITAMIRDQGEVTPDACVLDELTVSDLDADTLRRYRTLFGNFRPEHSWNRLPDDEFLTKIGAAKRGRDHVIHPTKAGLVCFADFNTISDVFPNFFLDPDRTWVEVEFESTEKRPESTEKSTGSSSESTEKSTVKFSETEERIIELMRENAHITQGMLSTRLGITRNYVAKITMSLTERGAIRRIGPDKGGVWEVLKK